MKEKDLEGLSSCSLATASKAPEHLQYLGPWVALTRLQEEPRYHAEEVLLLVLLSPLLRSPYGLYEVL